MIFLAGGQVSDRLFPQKFVWSLSGCCYAAQYKRGATAEAYFRPLSFGGASSGARNVHHGYIVIVVGLDKF